MRRVSVLGLYVLHTMGGADLSCSQDAAASEPPDLTKCSSDSAAETKKEWATGTRVEGEICDPESQPEYRHLLMHLVRVSISWSQDNIMILGPFSLLSGLPRLPHCRWTIPPREDCKKCSWAQAAPVVLPPDHRQCACVIFYEDLLFILSRFVSEGTDVSSKDD